MSKRKSAKKFANRVPEAGKVRIDPEYNLTDLYKRAYDELALQQSKRDQIISLYLAVFSFLIPFALSMEALSWAQKGWIFIAVGIIGVLFSFIVIRYRVYKEVYWLCCQSITNLYNYKQEEMDKRTVQAVFYQVISKKGSKYLVEKKGRTRIDRWLFIRKNLFSAETMHYMIQIFITSVILALGIALLTPFSTSDAVKTGLLSGVLILLILLAVYFSRYRAVYGVLEDGLDSSFNYAFSKAWFLHFYID